MHASLDIFMSMAEKQHMEISHLYASELWKKKKKNTENKIQITACITEW